MTSNTTPSGKIQSAVETSAVPAAVPCDKRPTKQELVLELLRAEGGAPLAAIVAATGWQSHTVRATLTGLRKKGHVIDRRKIDRETRYAIDAGAAS